MVARAKTFNNNIVIIKHNIVIFDFSVQNNKNNKVITNNNKVMPAPLIQILPQYSSSKPTPAS